MQLGLSSLLPRFRYTQACQRYWTSGGTLRNVPPGSGRRKSKSAAKDSDKERDKTVVHVQQQHSSLTANAGLLHPYPLGALGTNMLDPTAALQMAGLGAAGLGLGSLQGMGLGGWASNSPLGHNAAGLGMGTDPMSAAAATMGMATAWYGSHGRTGSQSPLLLCRPHNWRHTPCACSLTSSPPGSSRGKAQGTRSFALPFCFKQTLR